MPAGQILVVNMIERVSIYDIAAENPGQETANLLRVNIARHAVGEVEWVTLYDRFLAKTPTGVLRHPENIVMPAGRSWAPTFTVIGSTLEQATVTLREQAALLGAGCDPVDDIDLLAAVVASEIWFAALDADDLAYAAAKGPDAISSAAAILARAAGHGVMTFPFDPDWPALTFPLDGVLLAAAHCRDWAHNILGVDAWGEILARVVTDLSWRTRGGSKTHESALLLGVRGETVLPETFTG